MYKGKAPAKPRPQVRLRDDIRLSDEEVRRLDPPSLNLYNHLLRSRPGDNNWEFEDFHEAAFGYEGSCSIEIRCMMDIIKHDKLDASIIKFYCM